MKIKTFWITFLTFFFYSLINGQNSRTEIIILGNIQDAGIPHIGCEKKCCTPYIINPDPSLMVTSLGVVDYGEGKSFLFEASPDISQQLIDLKKASKKDQIIPDGIFLTHAHIGHYTGLMYFGREALGGTNISVYAMPQMAEYLKTNGPWSQLVSLNNISINEIHENQNISITERISVQPFQVPHRDEFSETVGYKIIGPNKTALFIPDIDKWQKWDKSIIEEIEKVDYAFLDGTFFDQNELPFRDMSLIPHPFIVESLELFSSLSVEQKSKIYFIHFNHTNPVISENSDATMILLESGFKIARSGLRLSI